MTSSHRPPQLVVETREIDPVDDLLAFTSPDEPLAWLRRGDGIVGVGTVGGYENGPQLPPGLDRDALSRGAAPISSGLRRTEAVLRP